MTGRGGYRSHSGRKKGSLNKATVEQIEIAERNLRQAKESGRKLAKEVLEEFMHVFAGMAAAHQPLPPGAVAQSGYTPDVEKFEAYSARAIECAKALAPYQSPTFRAVITSPPPHPTKAIVKKFTLNIFDNQGRPAPRQITVSGQPLPIRNDKT